LFLQVPAEVEVRKVDLAVELQVLAFHVARRSAEAVGGVTGAEQGIPPRQAVTGTRIKEGVATVPQVVTGANGSAVFPR
jgi:hypothetical protein